MSAREKLLLRLHQLYEPSGKDLPEIIPDKYSGDLTERFISSLNKNGGEGYKVEMKNLADQIICRFPDSRTIFNNLDSLDLGIKNKISGNGLTSMDSINLSILPGMVGVAENGSVWLDEKNLVQPRIPFISDNLVIVLPQRDIVYDLIEAYQKIDLINSNFGIFIAGPSKTADIEQSLVIGAQGASRHVVFLTF